MPPRATSLFPMLSVASMAASLRIYRDILGGAETYRYPSDGEPEFLVLRLGSSDIGLALMTDRPPIHGQPPRPAAGHRVELCIYVDDLDETVAALREQGITIVVEPVGQPWGERIAYVEDPDGNLLMLTR